MTDMTRLEVTRRCNLCKTSLTLNLDPIGYELWQSGVLIQDALPELDAGSRELLISGTCSTCFDNLFTQGWPGDGSGEDDLADYNSNQGQDT